MDEAIYVKLGERLNRNPVKLPLVKSVLALLRELFTEEQAALAAEMPLGAHTLKSLAGQLNRHETELEKLLETMADKGVIFVAKTETNEKVYSVPPYAPGIFELQFLKGEETEEAKKRARLVTDIHEELGDMAAELYKDVEQANKILGRPGLRTLAVEEELPGNAEIATWEQISKIMEQEESFAVGTCTCRLEAKFNGHPCKIDGVPMEACVYFGKVADYIVERKFGKRYSREELLDLLKTCEKHGLMHNINNFLGDNIVFCNCCGCCCTILKPMVEHRGLRRIAGSNFASVVDTKSCTACGACVDICQVGAIEMEDDTVKITQEYCMGCGNCVAQCPSGSLSLVRSAEYKPPTQHEDIVGFGV